MKRLHLVPGLVVLGLGLLAVSAGRSEDCEPQPPTPLRPPGVGIRVSADFLKHDLAQCFRRSFPVAERVEEGHYSSLIQVAARAYLAPVPCSRGLAANVVVYGNLLSDTVRSAESVSLMTQEQSSFFISQEVIFNERCISLGGLAVSMPIHSRLLGVNTCLRGAARDLVEDYAPSIFERRRCKDDLKISGEAEMKMRRQIYQQGRQVLCEANKRYREEFLDRIEKNGFERGDLRFSSDECAVYLTAQLPGLKLPEPPPLPDRAIVVQLHPDAFNLLANRILAGKSYNEEQLEKIVTDLSRYLDLPPLAKREERELTITLAKKDPLTLKIEDDLLIFTLGGESYKVGENVYPGMNVTARYRIERKGEELHLVRQGEIEPLPPDFKPGMTLGARQEVLRTILRRRFGRLLSRDVALRGIAIPEDAIPESAREQGLKLGGSFRIDVLDTAKGWLTAGVRYSPGNKPAAEH